MKRYTGDSRFSRKMRIHPGQEEASEWFDDYITARIAGEELEGGPIYSCLLAGGRRSGKTDLCTKMIIALALAFPDSICWIVCPSNTHFEEIEDALMAAMPKLWYRHLGAPWFRYSFANGSRIVLRSGHYPPALKKGRCDFAFFNEGQQQAEKSWVNVRAAIADQGGLVIIAANPPDTGDRGTWVGDFAVDCQSAMEVRDRGDIANDEARKSVFFHLDPLNNPHINQEALRALRAEVDERTFDIEVRGLFLSPKDSVFYNWDRIRNERPTPVMGDVTAKLTKALEGREFDRVVGVDVQKFPFMAAVEYRFFHNSAAPDDMDRVLMWATSELALEGADEIDMCADFDERGWDPERTMIVCDASGEWQQAERDPLKLKERNITGRGSYDLIRSAGYKWVYKPDRNMKKNPDIVERIRSTCSRIQTQNKEVYLLSDPGNKLTNKCFREWTTVYGQPSRRSKHAHLGDALSYPVWRLFPRMKRATGLGYEKIKRKVSSFERDLGRF